MSGEIGKRIGDYEILGVLGAGGMGQVFKVRNVISDRVEAMKVLLPDLAGRQDLANRFLREIKVLAALNHPNIASLRTALTLDNQLVMVMEYVEGTTLAARLEQGAIPPLEALNYIDQVLNALSYAHKQNVIHRDIKPGNMMLTPQGVIKLMDFGIARSGSDRSLTSTGMTLGSLHYMSPEQVRGAAIDARSDLYSVGISLYEMVTGKPPFQADSDYSLMAAQLQQEPKPPIDLCPGLPAELNDVILTALQKEPDNRFQSADAFRRAASGVNSSLSRILPSPAMGTAAGAGATELFRGTLPTTPVRAATTASVSATPSVQPTPQPVAASVPPQPVPAASAPPPRTHRGLYMSMGALIVLAVLVAAGLYIPRRSSTRAHEDGNDQPQQSIATQPEPGQSMQPNSSQPAATVGNSSQPSEPGASSMNPAGADENAKPSAVPDSSTVRTLASTAANKSHAGSKHSTPAPSEAAPATSERSAPMGQPENAAGSATSDMASVTQQQSATEAQLQELEQQMDQLSSRASSVDDSLNTLRQQQSTQGYGLRGDISSAQQMMKTYMAKAQTALQNQDAKNAKKYLDLAQPQVETLEKFLGR
jgi:eukaryotic-like serine/threonine-protein kinase